MKKTVFLLLGVLFAIFPLSAQTAKRPSVALVLAGGGAKGYAHIPVLELIDELGIPVDMIIGTSAGSIIGGLYAAGYTPELMKQHLFAQDWVKIINDRPRYSLEKELGSLGLDENPLRLKFSHGLTLELGKGFSTGEAAYRLFKTLTAKIPSYINFDDLAIPFRAVSAELLSGDMEIMSTGDLAEVIRASISIPGVFEPFIIDGKHYVDGMMRNNLPISVAKEMGYDVIIAVEISDTLYEKESDYDSVPIMALFQLYSVYLKTVNEPQYLLADTVILPNVQHFNPLDFSKAKEIYEASARDKAKYREMLLQVREKIFPNGPPPPAQALDPQRIASYEQRSALTPKSVEIYGELPFDRPYIRKLLDRMILRKPLTEENLGAFIDEVYRTGNYLFVTCRVNTRSNNTSFEVHLNPVKQKSAMLLFGGSYRGTIANDAISKLDLSTTLQWRGLTGTGSVLSFSATLVNDFAARFQFMQPLFQKSFVQADLEFMQDQDFITSGFESREISGIRILRAEGGLKVGVKFDRQHLFTFGPRLVWMDTSRVTGIPETAPDSDGGPVNQADDFGIPISLDYTFSTLDFSCLPTRGFFVNVNNQTVFTLRDGDSLDLPPLYNVLGVDFTAVVSLNEQISVAASLFAGSDVTFNLTKIPSQMPIFGFNTFDRMFFPQVAGKQLYGAHKGAAAITLQLHPWKNVTILGGQLFFSVSAGIGQVVSDFADFSKDKLLWNANLATGFRISDAFGVQLRLGAGTREFTNRVTPFISLDIGNFRL